MIEIRQGDALKLIKEIPDESIDLVFADFPFNCQDGRKDYVGFVEEITKEFYRVLKKDCPLIVVNNPRNMWKTHNAFKLFTLRDCCVLIRSYTLSPAWHFGFRHNYLYVFLKGNNIRKKWNGTKKNYDKEFHSDVFRYNVGFRLGRVFHPQALPLNLVMTFIKLFTDEGDMF